VRLYDYEASANCYKARLLLALLDRPYERVAIDIFAGDTLTDEYGRLNPGRETPVLETDGGDVLTQSNAIAWFIAEGTDLLPHGALARGRIVQWLSFEQEQIMRGIGNARFRMLTGRDSAGLAGRVALGRSALEILEDHLARHEFLVGDCTVADICVFAYTHVAEDSGHRLRGFPNVEHWLDRIRALPRFMDDLVPYPPNARPGAGRSIYD
jgi:glutathione S-transferase